MLHGMACLLHEKPFAGINGSGKHNNWSLVTSSGKNLLDPTDDPGQNPTFLVFLCAVLAAVDDYADLLRLSATCPGNEFRLGGGEAPPSVISVFLGDPMEQLLAGIAEGHIPGKSERAPLLTGVKSLPLLMRDDNDRNRTSPFAFTGNKFEFRMVGASQSIGLYGRNFPNRDTVMEYFRPVIKENGGDKGLTRLPLLLFQHGVEAPDSILLQPLHRAAAVQDKHQFCQIFSHDNPP